jgi:hypothetical protein
MEQAYAKRRYVLDAGAWTPVVCPITADYLNIRNTGANSIQMTTDTNNPDSFDDLVAGEQDGINQHRPLSFNYKQRFAPGDVVIYLRSALGAGEARVTFC